MSASIRGRDLPATDGALDAWCEKHDTPKNRKALAAVMAEMAMGDITGGLAGKADHLAEWIELWLGGTPQGGSSTFGQDSADIVAAMADVYPGMAQVAERLEHYGDAASARRIREQWDGYVPTLADFAEDDAPSEPEDRPGADR